MTRPAMSRTRRSGGMVRRPDEQGVVWPLPVGGLRNAHLAVLASAGPRTVGDVVDGNPETAVPAMCAVVDAPLRRLAR